MCRYVYNNKHKVDVVNLTVFRVSMCGGGKACYLIITAYFDYIAIVSLPLSST